MATLGPKVNLLFQTYYFYPLGYKNYNIAKFNILASYIIVGHGLVVTWKTYEVFCEKKSRKNMVSKHVLKGYYSCLTHWHVDVEELKFVFWIFRVKLCQISCRNFLCTKLVQLNESFHWTNWTSSQLWNELVHRSFNEPPWNELNDYDEVMSWWLNEDSNARSKKDV